MPLLEVADLRVSFHTRHGIVRAVDEVSFQIEKGETLGIVGESGSGKSVTCYSLLGLLPPPPGCIRSGAVCFDGMDLLRCSDQQLRGVRGKRVAMIFQDPMTSLNPYLRVGDQIIEPLMIHEAIRKADAVERALGALEEVGIRDGAQRLRSYPHELSGGMRQRVMIAMALITNPELIVADEPTTALDVTVQAQVLDLLERRREKHGTAIIFVTHDLGVVSGFCDRVAVMYGGRIVERGAVAEVFRAPMHPYNQALQWSIPATQPRGRELYTIRGQPPDPSARPPGCPFLPRCDHAREECRQPVQLATVSPGHESACTRVRQGTLVLPSAAATGGPDRAGDIPAPASAPGELFRSLTAAPAFLQIENLEVHFPVERGFLAKKQIGSIRAVDGINLTLRRGEVLGLVGESGCGKSTLGRAILQLIKPTSGKVVLAGRNLAELRGNALREARAGFQMIFQDPSASLNPRMTVYDTLSEALATHHRRDHRDMPGLVSALMERVGLSPRFLRKYPHEHSSGQRQRIAIARALAVEPRLIIADEPVSALDVSIQAQIINLLARLTRETGMTMIFISHDLSVVRHIADRIAVMYLGRFVELGPAEEVCARPIHPYTKALVSAIPIVDPGRAKRRRVILSGDPPSSLNPPQGCTFHPRCPSVQERCKAAYPPLVAYAPGRLATCVRLFEINPDPGGS